MTSRSDRAPAWRCGHAPSSCSSTGCAKPTSPTGFTTGRTKKEQQDDPDAERRLHADVYFLTLSIRRLLLFHGLLATHVQDPRLHQARAKFDVGAPKAKELRDFYEHLDEYLLDSPRKHVKFEGRAAPMLHLRWDCDNVVVSFGERELDITLAVIAAIELGRESEALWTSTSSGSSVRTQVPARHQPTTGSNACWRSGWESPQRLAARTRATSSTPASSLASKC